MFRRIIIIIAAGLVLAGGIIFAATYSGNRPSQIEAVEIVEIEEEDTPEEEPRPSTAERVIKALAAAYPRRITNAEFRNDDWAVLMDDVWYYYAGGRMLPEELMEQQDGYTGSFGISSYQSELPPWTEPTPEQSERYRDAGRDAGRTNTNTRNNSDNNEAPRIQRQRSQHFREALWQASNGAESSRRVESIDFLGKKVVLHSDIVAAISLAE
jgi:hypothetical protein